jgi:hypothetical protein
VQRSCPHNHATPLARAAAFRDRGDTNVAQAIEITAGVD